VSIAYKEARETDYWLRILERSGYIDNKMFKSISSDCEELMKILGTIKKTLLIK
jgi:four helix bundle protein